MNVRRFLLPVVLESEILSSSRRLKMRSIDTWRLGTRSI